MPSAPRASLASPAPTCPASSRWTTSTRRSACSTAGSRRRSAGRPRPAGAVGGARRRGWPAAVAPVGGAPPARPPAQPRARRPRGTPPLRPARRVLRALSRPSMTYSCAIFSRGAQTLEEAQEQSWSSCAQSSGSSRASGFSTSAAAGAASRPRREPHGVAVTGITLSGRRRAWRAAGRGGRCRPAHRHTRHGLPRARRASASTRSRASAWSSTWARARIDLYARRLAGLLRPGGRLLNHGIARLRHGDPEAGPFSQRYVFPDAAPLHLSRVIAALEGAGLETTHVEGFRHDYAETLRHWARRLDDSARAGHQARRPRAGPRLAPLPARGPQRLRDRIHLRLPNAVHTPITGARSAHHVLKEHGGRVDRRRGKAKGLARHS